MVERVPVTPTQTWTIDQTELNSYLARMFALPLNENGKRIVPNPPPPISEPVVTFAHGTFTISARLARVPGPNPLGGVASLVYDVQVKPQTPPNPPVCIVQLKSAWIGSLPVPTSVVSSRIRDAAASVSKSLLDRLEMETNSPSLAKVETQVRAAVDGVAYGTPFAMQYEANHKRFTITNIVLDDGKLSVTLSQTPAGATTSQP